MKLVLLSCFAAFSTAFAAGLAPVSYHDGTLVSAPAADEFLVRSEGILYSLTPVSSGERAPLGLGRPLNKLSSLDNQAPGTEVKVRDDGRHFFVRVGHRETMYVAVESR